MTQDELAAFLKEMSEEDAISTVLAVDDMMKGIEAAFKAGKMSEDDMYIVNGQIEGIKWHGC